jgi:hypothetical protein
VVDLHYFDCYFVNLSSEKIFHRSSFKSREALG